jgi:class 3 adenylate cyclase
VSPWDEPAPVGRPPSEAAVRDARERLGAAGDALVDWLVSAADEALWAIRLSSLPPGVPRSLDLWLAAHERGVVALRLLLVCDWCGAIARSATALCEVRSTFHCNACRYDAPSQLDVTIEVVFQPAPWLRSLAVVDPLALPTGPAFRIHHYHPAAVAPDGEGYERTLREHTLALRRLFPGESFSVDLRGAPRDVLEVVALPGAASHVTVFGEHGTTDGGVVFREGAFHPATRNVAAGIDRVVLTNEGSSAVHVFAFWMPRSVRPLQPARIPAMVAARDLFLHPGVRARHPELIRPVDGLAVRDVTLWFSDIQGSTALYEEAGDLEAYVRVQRHFAVIDEIVRREGGAVVKTLGDAVMAVFPRPGPALRAARDALVARAGQFELRIGVHRGGALAIDAFGIPDLFGQTVNLAARLQSFATAGEIAVTTPTLDDAEAAAAVAGFSRDAAEAVFKGFPRPVSVTRLAP